jgi:PHD/YefM family antitoxin component YafN of YafNO toxin-antitoxin module
MRLDRLIVELLGAFPKAASFFKKYYFSTIMKIEFFNTLKRQTTKPCVNYERKKPVLITAPGRPSAYLVDVDQFDKIQQIEVYIGKVTTLKRSTDESH